MRGLFRFPAFLLTPTSCINQLESHLPLPYNVVATQTIKEERWHAQFITTFKLPQHQIFRMPGQLPLKGIALFVKILRDWFPVLQTLHLRPVVISEIKKVLNCRNPKNGTMYCCDVKNKEHELMDTSHTVSSMLASWSFHCCLRPV